MIIMQKFYPVKKKDHPYISVYTIKQTKKMYTMNRIFAFIALCISGFVQPTSSWELVWEDEFEKDALQSEYWNIADNFTHGDQELQLYVKEQVSVNNGQLILKTASVDKATGPDGKKIYHFTSGWVDTKFKVNQTFGKFVVRAKLPNPDAYGIWPAIWMMPSPNKWNCWPLGGEIDIMEATGGEVNNTVYGTYHWGKNRSTPETDERAKCTEGCGCDLWDGHNGKFLQFHNFSAGFNDFAVVWDESGLSWFVNDVLYHERSLENVPFIPTEPFYMILNTAIDWWNKKSGTPLNAYPVEFTIDFVRFYAKT